MKEDEIRPVKYDQKWSANRPSFHRKNVPPKALTERRAERVSIAYNLPAVRGTPLVFFASANGQCYKSLYNLPVKIILARLIAAWGSC